MNFNIITIFPEAFESYLNSSILKRAQKSGLIKINFYNPRDYVGPAKSGASKHKTVDDRPFGGGPGMVMQALPILKAVEQAKRLNKRSAGTKIILLSARGKQFSASMARDFAKKYKNIILISGRYEGIDERVKKIIKNWKLKIEELSIGPYVLTGGELPSEIIIDAVSRHIPGVLGKNESLEEKHGSYPVYTRPEIIKYKNKNYKVPPVLLSGNHKKIEEWRKRHELS